MASGGNADIIVPAERVEGAMRGLRRHMGAILGAARWLEGSGHHAAAAYFAILCMEEAAKYHVMSGCRDDGRGVGKRDMCRVGRHEKKISLFLCEAARRAGGLPGAGLPPLAKMVATLIRVKELSVYFEHANGVACTLEGLLGPGPTKRAARLLVSAAERGVPAERRQGDGGAGSQASAGAVLAEVAAMTANLSGDSAGKLGGEVPRDQLDAALSGLHDHLAVLCRVAHELLEGGHVAASVFMEVIALEEGCRHYMLAKCRREERNAEARDLRGMASHKTKLQAFFRDAAVELERADARNGGGERTVLDPKSLVRLNAVKELAIYFEYMGDEEVTLEGIFGSSARNLAEYVEWLAQGLVSCMVICDGDAGSPRRRDSQNSDHYERRRRFEVFVRDPENAEQCAGWHKMAGMLKELNDAARNLDVKGSKHWLAAIREYGNMS